MPKIIAQKWTGGKPFEVFTGNDAECDQKMICIKFDQALGSVTAGIAYCDYIFQVQQGGNSECIKTIAFVLCQIQ
jgi:hypothetical protein